MLFSSLWGGSRHTEGVGGSTAGVSQSFVVRQDCPARVSYAHGLPCAWDGERPVQFQDGSGSRIQAANKRLFDILISLVVLLFLLPLLVLVALAVRLNDPGPIFFLQDREGRDGRSFRIVKFRSMRHSQACPGGVEQTRMGDARISAIGSFLRRTSIDELPQFYNVLLGDMSLVGPRPHVSGQLAGGRPYRDVVPFYDMRLRVKPGITGWAQVSGLRGSTEDPGRARARIEHDIAYIQNQSLVLDFKILVMTAVREFIGGNGN